MLACRGKRLPAVTKTGGRSERTGEMASDASVYQRGARGGGEVENVHIRRRRVNVRVDVQRKRTIIPYVAVKVRVANRVPGNVA